MKRYFLFILMLAMPAIAQDAVNVEQVGRIYNFWETAASVQVQDDLAYVCTKGSGLQIVDISNPEQPEIVGYWDDNPYMAVDVAVRGDFAYVADFGLHCINISDPQHPQSVGSFDLLLTRKIFLGQYAYLIAQNFRKEWGVFIIDISDPTQPACIAEIITPETPKEISVVNNHAYVKTFLGLYIYDLTIIDEPVLIHEQEYYGTRLLFGNGKFYIFDSRIISVLGIQDDYSLELIGQIEVNSNWDIMTIAEEFLFYSDRENFLHAIDVSNPEEMVEIGDVDMSINITCLNVSGGFLCASCPGWSAGLRMVNIEDPENMQVVGELSTPYLIDEIKIVNNLAFASNGPEGLRVLDISNPGDPEEIAVVDVFNCTCVTADERYIYTVDYPAGFHIYDYSDLDNIDEVGFLEEMYGTTIEIENDLVFLFRDLEGIQIIDVSDRENPQFIYFLYTENRRGNFKVKEGIVYDCWGSWGSNVTIYDVHDLNNISIRGVYVGNCDPIGIDAIDDIIYVTCRNMWIDGVRQSGIGLKIFDISDPEQPQELGTFIRYLPYDYIAGGIIEVRGNYAYIASFYGGLRVIDVSDPENPVEAGYYVTPGEALDVDVRDDGLIGVADKTNLGFYTFEYIVGVDEESQALLPESPFLASPFPNPFNSTTTIGYSLLMAGNVSLTVYDLSGRLVANLADGAKPAGTHEAVWTADGVSSGVYMVALDAGSMVLREKVVLVK